MSKAASASTGFFAMIEAPKPNNTGLKDSEVSVREDIRFRDVTFAYPSRPGTTVLKKLNLTIPAAKNTAIVGPSGSGKSTIVGLVERWYQLTDINVPVKIETEKKDEKEDAKKSKTKKFKSKKKSEDNEESSTTSPNVDVPEVIIQNSGSISIGEHDITTLDVKFWRSSIGIVVQEPFLFNASIFQNVANGLIGSQWENEDTATKRALVEEACKEAFADEFVKRLPNGYDTMVGEGGIKLSGGQRQRLAIARSIVKKPTILILDEATSSIDVRGERIVQAALDRVSKNRTTITIAHRLSTIKKADRIVVLKEGSAVEEGTHETLLADENGVYRNLVIAQHLDIGSAEDETASSQELEIVDMEELERGLSKADTSKVQLLEDDTDKEYRQQGIFKTVGLFLYEQRRHYIFYAVVLVSAMICAASYARQSFIFAKLLEAFQFVGQRLIDAGSFWALMFFILAIANGIAYFGIGFAAQYISVVCIPTLQTIQY